MYYYNVTCRVEPGIESEWLKWMIEVHIPEVLASQCFVECKLLRLMQEDNNQDGPIYAVQYVYKKTESFEKYTTHFGPALKQKTWDKYGDKVLAFRTNLEILHTFQPA
jgi:hypothetical protein